MKSLARAYSHIRSGATLICEEADASGLSPVPDEEIQRAGAIPQQYAKFYVPGSGKARWADTEVGTWNLEFLLKFPAHEWTDGTEDRESTFDYVEAQVKNELPESGGVPGEGFVHSYAIVVDEQSNDQVITVRCVLRGGTDV